MAKQTYHRDATASTAPKPFDTWTQLQRDIFLDRLAGTSNIASAAEAVGQSRGAIARLRQTDPQFARAFADALEAGYALLEADLLDRARNGIPKTVIDRKNELVELREFDCKLGLALLDRQAKRPATVATPADVTSIEEQDRIMADIAAHVEELKQERMAIIAKHLAAQDSAARDSAAQYPAAQDPAAKH